MDPKHIVTVTQQDAIFDGPPVFTDPSLVINVVNHNALGGTLRDLQEIVADPEAFAIRNGATRYKVTVCVYAEPYDDGAST